MCDVTRDHDVCVTSPSCGIAENGDVSSTGGAVSGERCWGDFTPSLLPASSTSCSGILSGRGLVDLERPPDFRLGDLDLDLLEPSDGDLNILDLDGDFKKLGERDDCLETGLLLVPSSSSSSSTTTVANSRLPGRSAAAAAEALAASLRFLDEASCYQKMLCI